MRAKWGYWNQKDYLNEIFIRTHKSQHLTINSKLIKDLAEIYSNKFPKHDNLPDAILGNMANIYLNFKEDCFLTPSIKNGIGHFMKTPNKLITLHNKNLKEKLIVTTLKIMKSEGINPQLINYDINLTPIENIENTALKLKLTQIEVACSLYNQKDIFFLNDQITRASKFEKLINQENSKEFNNNIRKKISEIFNHETKDYNLFLLNDGTGSGKTYNVVHSYLDIHDNYNEINTNTRRNLVFMAPQKTQLYIDGSIYEKAKDKNIPLLFARSQEDLVNLSSKSFFNYNNNTNSFEDLSYFFNKLFSSFNSTQKKNIDSILKNMFFNKYKDTYKDEESNENEQPKKMVSFSIFESCYKNYANFESNYIIYKEINKEYYDKEFDRVKTTFLTELKSLAEFLACNIDELTLFQIFNFGGIYKSFDNFSQAFNNNAKLYELAYWLILYVLPFEASKYINSIIFMTGQKSQTLLPIVVESKRNKKNRIIKTFYLEELISGYSVSSEADIIKHIINQTPIESFIEQEYFIKDPNNYFLRNNIPFSLVIDEEHELYNEFIDKNTTKKITNPIFGNNVNIIHAFAGIFRWLENINAQSILISTDRITQEKTKIINRLINELHKNTVLKTVNEVFDFFKFFSPNELGMFIESKNYESISNIFQNIVAYTPKIILRQEELDDIKIILVPGDSKIILTKTQPNISTYKQYSAFDFLQIILTALYVLKDCSSILKKLSKYEENTNNQNSALYNFINIAFQNKDFLENLFTSSLQLKDTNPITLSFVYILSKICFNFNLRKETLSDYFIKELIPIEPEISIIRELPEISLLQALKNPQNKAFLLSATRGFNNNYSGSYSDQFFEHITTSIPNALKILKRENLKDNTMPSFIEYRFSKRQSISFNSIDFDNQETSKINIANINKYKIFDISLSELDKSKTVQPIFNQENITNNNKNYLNSAILTAVKHQQFYQFSNKYHKQEYKNILNSIIHTYNNDKSAMILGLSNKFYDLFMKNTNYLGSVFPNYKCLLEDKSNKIIEFKPSINEKKIRLVFFDAELGKKPNLKDWFKESTDTILIVVSSYKSAGTGLNLTIETNKGNKDFDSIYFVTDVFWSSIKTSQGINSLNNLIVISKHLQHLGNKTISDLAEGVYTSYNKKLLEQEHLIEQTKVILQGLGRVERTDKNTNTNIYFVKSELCDTFTLFMTRIYRLFKMHSPNYENTAIANLSMNAKAAIKTAVNYVEANSFPSNQRNKLENWSKHGYNVYSNFFENTFPKLLKNFREYEPNYSWVDEFNSILREYYYPTYDFKGNLIDFLKKHQDILKKIGIFTEIRELIQYTDFDFEENEMCTNFQISDQGTYYSDLSNGSYLISDDSLFGYCNGIYNFEDKFLSEISQQLSYSKTSFTKLPNPYLKNLIQGNVAEYVCLQYLKRINKNKNLKFEINKIKNLFGEEIYRKTYELVDIYITHQGKIYGIDVKSWGLYHDGGFKKLLQRLPNKQSILLSTLGTTHSVNIIYINMHPNINPSADGGTSRYLKNFPNVNYFDFFNKQLSWREYKNKNNSHYVPETEFYSIDNTLENLL